VTVTRSADWIEDIDRLTEIIRRDCPFKEKYDAYFGLLGEQLLASKGKLGMRRRT
jgi:hypothetical protein